LDDGCKIYAQNQSGVSPFDIAAKREPDGVWELILDVMWNENQLRHKGLEKGN